MEQENIVFNTEDVKGNKVYGVLAYFGILFLIPLFAAKDSQYAKFHANQGLLLFIFNIALQAIGRIAIFAATILSFGVLNTYIRITVNTAVGIISLVYFIIGIVNACSGEAKTLPVIGGITLVK
ncbi:MAG: hypothetical protein J1F22_01025 [Lachnospiraceae bacterium]|nr:hypothetical protein [Lachnospiraceae bacterium]